MDFNFIKDTVFKTVEFNFDKEIEYYSNDGLYVSYDGDKAKIGATFESEFARGCFLLAMNISQGKNEFVIEEKRHFQDCGVMVDCSRNAVMKVEVVKKYINYLSCLGYNFLMLYTEDTYELDKRPRFGYLRGKYTKEELRDISAYGEKMGVEVIPCIQTLGHMEQYIKWAAGGTDPTGEKIGKIVDTSSVLLCDEEATYDFIEQAIKTCKEAYRTDRIHIGMDEADGVGMGAYLRKHGLQNRFEIMNNHLVRVLKICEKYDMKPMIWSDMYFRLATGGAYYRFNFEFPDWLREKIPDVQLVYWDYYHDMVSTYDKMFAKHYELSDNIAFAGIVGVCNSLLPTHDYVLSNSVAAIKSCLKQGVQTVFSTIWGDDGNEVNAMLSNPLLPVYSEYCYKGESCTEEDIANASEFLTKIKFEDARAMGSMSFIKNNELLNDMREIYGNDLMRGKRLFYCDILYDMSVNASSCDEIMAIYDSCGARMDELVKLNDRNRNDYRYASLIYKICSLKAEFVKNLRKEYKNGNKEYLQNVLNEKLPQLVKWYEELHMLHKKQWMEVYKPFGFEVLSFRYGGLVARVKDAADVIDQYLKGEIDKIDELEEEIIYNEESYPAFVNRLLSPSGQM